MRENNKTGFSMYAYDTHTISQQSTTTDCYNVESDEVGGFIFINQKDAYNASSRVKYDVLEVMYP